MQITKEKFMEHYNVSEAQMHSAKISWSELMDIAQDYEKRCREIYEPIRNEFLEQYFWNREAETGLQSYRSRCKKAEHVLEKIIRKRNDNYLKYGGLNKDNYWKYLTDLIGVRGLLLYREDWVMFHQYILKQIQNDASKYVKNWEADYDGSKTALFMAEAPKVHIRSGDYYQIYEDWFPMHCILDQKHYRSIHYIINYKGVYIEIQIRTLLEEGWGEIDHDIIYPRERNNAMLEEFSELLNRLVGMGDEMGAYYRRLQKVPKEEFKGKERMVEKPKNSFLHSAHHSRTEETVIVTYQDAIDWVIRE